MRTEHVILRKSIQFWSGVLNCKMMNGERESTVVVLWDQPFGF